MRRLGLEILGMGCAARRARAAGVAVACALAALLGTSSRTTAQDHCLHWEVESSLPIPLCFLEIPWSYSFVDMNDAGVCVGNRTCIQGDEAIIWDGDGPVQPIDFPSGYGESRATGINDAGVICGSVTTPGGGPIARVGFVIDAKGSMTFIEPPEGSSQVFPQAINDSGLVVGYYGSGTGTPPYTAFTWQAGEFTSLRERLGEWVIPNDVNDAGEIVGFHRPGFPKDIALRPMSIANGGLTSLAIPPGAVDGEVRSVNAAGTKVGQVRMPAGVVGLPPIRRAAIWDGDGAEFIEPTPTCQESSFSGITDSGLIKGSNLSCDPVEHDRHLWFDGRWLETSEVIESSDGEIRSPRAMNDAGLLLVRGRDHVTTGGEWVGLAMPLVAVPGDVDCDRRVGFEDILMVLASWGACGPGSCHADLSSDGEVGVPDLMIVIDHWGP